MKKSIIFTLIITMLFTTYFNVANTTQTYANVLLELTSSDKDVLNKYVNKIKLVNNNNIDLIAKNAIHIKKNDAKALKEYINNIYFTISQINTLSKDIDSYYQANKKNKDKENYLLAMSAILSNYKFALTQLKLHLQSEDDDISFKSLGLYYIIMNDANVQLNQIKSELSK